VGRDDDAELRRHFSNRFPSSSAIGVQNSMKYRSVADLDEHVVAWLKQLPADLELIVGIPRSGLLAANLLALHLNLPMTDVDGLIEGRVLQAGPRYSDDASKLLEEPRRVLVVDDSVLLGRQLEKVKTRVKAAQLPHAVSYAAVYPAPASEHLVDFYFETLETPRCFEWNLMHHPWVLSKTCMDIDGVLCRDPTQEENDDGPQYRQFLTSSERLYLPSVPVRWLVTARLEKYRGLTEEWLRANGVEYGELIMMDYPDMAARREANAYASFKSDAYASTGALLFVESSPSLAAEIAHLSGKSVFCMETRTMIDAELLSRMRRTTRELPRLPRRVGTALKSLGRFRPNHTLGSRSGTTTRRPR
jgi:orotate phosphoribosyltransferase